MPFCSKGTCGAFQCTDCASPDATLDSRWSDVVPVKGNGSMSYFRYDGSVGGVTVFMDWVSLETPLAEDEYHTFEITLKRPTADEVWSITLYGNESLEYTRDGTKVFMYDTTSTTSGVASAGASTSVSVGTTTFGASTTQGLQIETVPFGACGSYAFHATGNLASPHRVFEFCIPVEVSMDVVVSSSSSSGSEAVSSLLTVPNDDSGILSVIPIALFGSEAVRATGSLLLSFAGGDTACLVGPSHSDAAWAALQHGISAAFALEPWQVAVEGVEEGASGLLANFSATWVGGSNVSAQDLQSSFDQDVMLSTVNKDLAEVCKDVPTTSTFGLRGSGSASPSTAIPCGISVRSIEAPTVVMSETIDLEATLHFESGAEDIVALDSFSELIQVVFSQLFHIDVSMISIGSVEATSATAIHISFSATGSGLSTTMISSSASQMTTSFQQEFVSRSLSYTISSVDGVTAAVSQAKTIDAEATLHFGSASAKEIVALDSFSEMILVVFSQLFNIDVSMISIGSVEATSATAIHISFSATGSGLSTTTISGSASQMTTSFQHEFVSRSLSYTVSSVDGVTAAVSQGSSIDAEAASAKEIVALDSFSEVILVVFSQFFHIDVSMISVGSVEATSATAIHMSFSATGTRISTGLFLRSATLIMTSFQKELVVRTLRYTISSVDGLTAVASEVSATANTCSSSNDCADSVAPMCVNSKCVAMSCGGG
eukprot:CAMPEP_0194555686 /NCGR_PEP_ID=MMETSP0253-20130528/98365_1 /TAXON_ID=2966 /ORGANISM="Noctiluca scintillans" /LENGTH=716 /DNA_ID=CAMNT_0039403185 /DNA_START=160 /DNA_END=2307 /DNA_ORIENTATION=+